MTYDELSNAINKEIIIAPPFAVGGYTRFLQALAAVVELHKPVYRGCNESWCCGSYDVCACGENYPCTTIQAIEKELT